MPTVDDILRAQRRQNIFDRVSSGSSSTAPAPSVFERLSSGLTEPLPMEGRLSFLPAMVTPERGREWALPGVLAGAWNAFTAPGRALQGQEVGPDEALNVAGMTMLSGMPVPKPTGQGVLGLNVFHGSPHKFDKFDMSKVGTGEGAQAYGHGLYLAEQPSTAAAYKQAGLTTNWADHVNKIGDTVFDQLGPTINGKVPFGPNQTLYSREEFKALNAANPTEVWARLSPSTRTKVENIITPKGNLYKVDLPDEHIAKMLDWDKPLSQQPHIANAITPESMGLQFKQLENGYMGFVNERNRPIGNMQKGGTPESFRERWINDFLTAPDGRELYKRLGLTQEEGSRALAKAGIPGIRYLDQGSRTWTPPRIESGSGGHTVFWGNDPSPVGTYSTRAAAEAAAKALDTRSSNFVVFDDKIPKILSRE